jgi:glucose/arabinose dehydrogenase
MRTAILSLAACIAASAALAQYALAQTYPPGWGPNPLLPEPNKKLIPTVNVAPVERWKGDDKPLPASGFSVSAYARDLDHPRWLYVLPNGDVLVAPS